jgi:hypothetical protein
VAFVSAPPIQPCAEIAGDMQRADQIEKHVAVRQIVGLDQQERRRSPAKDGPR